MIKTLSFYPDHLTNKNINTLVFSLKWNYMRENQPRLTLTAAYIRHEINDLNVYGSHKMQIACTNGSGLSFQPDWSNDDISCFGTLQNLQQWLKRAKKPDNWLWSGKERNTKCHWFNGIHKFRRIRFVRRWGWERHSFSVFSKEVVLGEKYPDKCQKNLTVHI